MGRSALQRGDRPQQFRLDTREQPYLAPEGRPFDLYRTWGWGGMVRVRHAAVVAFLPPSPRVPAARMLHLTCTNS